MHYRALLNPTDFIGPQDCDSPFTATISRVVREVVQEGKPEKAPIMYFKNGEGEAPKKFKVPKSVMYGLSLTFGNDVDTWVGQTIELYKAWCMSFGEEEECVRVRFAPDIDTKIRKWLKKRGASPNAYMIIK